MVCGEVMKVLDILAGLCWKWWAGIVGVVVMFVGVGGEVGNVTPACYGTGFFSNSFFCVFASNKHTLRKETL